MWYRTLIASALSILLAVGCSSSPDVEDDVPRAEKPHADEVDEPRATYVAEAYEDAARWLPADALGVFVQAGEPFWDQFGELLLPMANPDAEPGDAGTLEGLQDDLAEFSRQFFGFDTWQVDSVAVAIHAEGGVGVAFGDVEHSLDLPTVDVGDQTAYVIDLTTFMEDDLIASDLQDLEDQGLDTDRFSRLYLLPIDEPRNGFVGALDIAELEAAIAADERDTLAGSDAGDTYGEFFAGTEGAEVAIVGSLEKIDEALNALDDASEIEVADDFVDWTAFSYGDALTLTMTGDEQTLRDVESTSREILQDVGEMVDEYAPELAGNFGGDLALAYVNHKRESIFAQAEPQWLDDQTLRYELALSGGHLSRAWGASSIVAFFSVPLVVMGFQTGIEDALEGMEDEVEELGVDEEEYHESLPRESFPDDPDY